MVINKYRPVKFFNKNIARMKPKNFAVTVVAATTLIASCNWFSHKKKDDPSKALIGKWGFVTVPEKVDTTKKANTDSLALVASLAKDSLNTGIEFKTDSSYNIYSGEKVKDSGRYYVDSASRILYIKEDSTYEPLKIKKLTDSTIEFFLMKDSFALKLRKKQ